jgi:hypothetical protein
MLPQNLTHSWSLFLGKELTATVFLGFLVKPELPGELLGKKIGFLPLLLWSALELAEKS